MPARRHTSITHADEMNATCSGTSHFIWQRLTAAATMVLVLTLIPAISNMAHSDYDEIRGFLARPKNAILLLALIFFSALHMGLGAQVIIDDYIRDRGSNRILRAANVLFCAALFLSCLAALLKLTNGS